MGRMALSLRSRVCHMKASKESLVTYR
jgi:hypothetical protein